MNNYELSKMKREKSKGENEEQDLATLPDLKESEEFFFLQLTQNIAEYYRFW